MLKTTKSGFVNFIQDGYRSLPDQVDRIFSTIGKRSFINNVFSKGGGALCVEMGFYADISWESRCGIEINV